MTITKETAKIIIEGEAYKVWQQYEVTSAITAAARSFSFAATYYEPDEKEPFKISMWQKSIIKIDDEPILSGYIDGMNPGYSANTHSLKISGRSKTQDLIDCSAAPGSFQNQKIEMIAKKICEPFGINATCDVDTGDPIKKHIVQSGETCFESIQRMARVRSLLITDTPTGDLLFTRAGSSRAETNLGLHNIKSIFPDLSSAGRYSDYTCLGQASGNNENFAKAINQAKAKAQDDAVKRYRPLIVRANGQADEKRCKDRAIWEAATRLGKSISIDIEVQGHHQILPDGTQGGLWQHNQITHVTSKAMAIDDDFLIVSVTFSKSSSGTITKLNLAPLAGFEKMEPAKQTKKKKKAAKTSHFTEWEELKS